MVFLLFNLVVAPEGKVPLFALPVIVKSLEVDVSSGGTAEGVVTQLQALTF
jgi:hypothetical protein